MVTLINEEPKFPVILTLFPLTAQLPVKAENDWHWTVDRLNELARLTTIQPLMLLVGVKDIFAVILEFKVCGVNCPATWMKAEGIALVTETVERFKL